MNSKIANPHEPLIMCEDDTCSNQKSFLTIKLDKLIVDDKVKSTHEFRIALPDSKKANINESRIMTKEIQVLIEHISHNPQLLQTAIEMLESPTSKNAEKLAKEFNFNHSNKVDQQRALWILVPIIIGGLLIPDEAH